MAVGREKKMYDNVTFKRSGKNRVSYKNALNTNVLYIV